jgi:hypothetical protein
MTALTLAEMLVLRWRLRGTCDHGRYGLAVKVNLTTPIGSTVHTRHGGGSARPVRGKTARGASSATRSRSAADPGRACRRRRARLPCGGGGTPSGTIDVRGRADGISVIRRALVAAAGGLAERAGLPVSAERFLPSSQGWLANRLESDGPAHIAVGRWVVDASRRTGRAWWRPQALRVRDRL